MLTIYQFYISFALAVLALIMAWMLFLASNQPKRPGIRLPQLAGIIGITLSLAGFILTGFSFYQYNQGNYLEESLENEEENEYQPEELAEADDNNPNATNNVNPLNEGPGLGSEEPSSEEAPPPPEPTPAPAPTVPVPPAPTKAPPTPAPTSITPAEPVTPKPMPALNPYTNNPTNPTSTNLNSYNPDTGEGFPAKNLYPSPNL